MTSPYRQPAERTQLKPGDRVMFHGKQDMAGTVQRVFEDTIVVILDAGGMVRTSPRNFELIS